MNIELFEAAKIGDIDQITYWLDQGANVNFENQNSFGETPLCAAIASGSETAISLLIERGAAVNGVDTISKKPMMIAVERKSPKIIKTLLSAGATIEPECLEIAGKQVTQADSKLETLMLLYFSSRLNSLQAMYFLPMLYEHVKDGKTQTVKNELLSAYLSMDTDLVNERLATAYELDADFHLQSADLLKLIVRQYDISVEKLERICDDLLRKDLQNNSNLLITLARIIKLSSER